jgi:hypothetical protein
MDVRDLYFWAAEAKVKGLVRRMDAAIAALLPWQKPTKINSYMDSLRVEMMELEHEGEAERVDRENEKRIAKARETMDVKRADIRAKRAAGESIAPKRSKIPAKAKVIR